VVDGLSESGWVLVIDEFALTKGQIRKHNALCKSIGDKLGTAIFEKWLDMIFAQIVRNYVRNMKFG